MVKNLMAKGHFYPWVGLEYGEALMFTWQASCRFAWFPPLRVSPAHSMLLVTVLLDKY